MQEHQERVINERKELNERIDKLNNFILESEKFGDLDEVNRNLLTEQIIEMRKYSRILSKRIGLF